MPYMADYLNTLGYRYRNHNAPHDIRVREVGTGKTRLETAAKLGITALSKSIALDMKRYNVRSNCLSPWAWSRMTSSIPSATPEQKEMVEKLQRMGPEKNAPLAVFLASDAASVVTGADWAVDGGYSALGPEQALPAIPRLMA